MNTTFFRFKNYGAINDGESWRPPLLLRGSRSTLGLPPPQRLGIVLVGSGTVAAAGTSRARSNRHADLRQPDAELAAINTDLKAQVHVACRRPTPNTPILQRHFVQDGKHIGWCDPEAAQVVDAARYSRRLASSDRPANIVTSTRVNLSPLPGGISKASAGCSVRICVRSSSGILSASTAAAWIASSSSAFSAGDQPSRISTRISGIPTPGYDRTRAALYSSGAPPAAAPPAAACQRGKCRGCAAVLGRRTNLG